MLHTTTIYLHAETRHLAQNVGSIPRRKASQLILLDELFLDIRSQTPPERDGKREKTNTSASGRLAVSNSKGMVFRCGPCQHVDKAPINSPSPIASGLLPLFGELPDTRMDIIYSLSACLVHSKAHRSLHFDD